jgi:hypothetical protein
LKRAGFFAGMASIVLSQLPRLSDHAEFRADSPILLAAAYFLLSDAYKPRRNQADSLTDEYKRAALSALAVMTIRPFVPFDPERVDDMWTYLANPILALACANAWVPQRNIAEHFPFDYLKRFYLSLLALRIEAFGRFIDLVNEGGDYREAKPLNLSSSDIMVVDDWVLKIYMLVNQRR